MSSNSMATNSNPYYPERPENMTRANWTGPYGYGARHKHDHAPFTLWDAEKADFRTPIHEESDWMFKQFNATSISLYFPIIIVETDNPPDPPPLTVGAVAVKFISYAATLTITSRFGREMRKKDTGIPNKFTTGYEGPRWPEDPLKTTFKFTKWIHPCESGLRRLAESLLSFCNPRSVHILCPYIIVELQCGDQKEYQCGSLPRAIGGFSAVYHHDVEPTFKRLSTDARQTIPDASTGDSSDHAPFPRLLPSIEIPDGAYFSVDGISASVVSLQCQGVTLDFPPQSEIIPNILYSKSRLYRVFGSADAAVKAGLNGVAIVRHGLGEVGMAGFIERGNDVFVTAPCLDELIDGSWTVI